VRINRRTAIRGSIVLASMALVAENVNIPQFARIAPGILLVLALPGFALVCAILPAAEISPGELMLASLGASVAVATISAVLLAATVGLSQRSAAAVLAFITIVASICALLKTSRIQQAHH
jgi:uncharacterized membrane protein